MGMVGARITLVQLRKEYSQWAQISFALKLMQQEEQMLSAVTVTWW